MRTEKYNNIIIIILEFNSLDAGLCKDKSITIMIRRFVGSKVIIIIIKIHK